MRFREGDKIKINPVRYSTGGIGIADNLRYVSHYLYEGATYDTIFEVVRADDDIIYVKAPDGREDGVFAKRFVRAMDTLDERLFEL